MPDLDKVINYQTEILVFQGDDELSIQEGLQSLVKKFDSGAFAGMNSVRIKANPAQRDKLASQINTMPLGGDKRLVILDLALDTFKAKHAQEWLAEILKAIPESTVVALVIPDSKKYFEGKLIWQVGEKHWLRKVLEDLDKKIEWIEKPLPAQSEMPEWIMKEALAQGANFETSAAVQLANRVGNDLFQARQEIGKALSYCGKGTPVTKDVIQKLGWQSHEADIFKMVDAAGQRDSSKAFGLLRLLLQELPSQYILTMLARQIRLLIIAKEVMDEGGSEKDVIAACGAAPFLAKKLMGQARRFSMHELTMIYRKLDGMDESSKTGLATMDVELELLVAELSK